MEDAYAFHEGAFGRAIVLETRQSLVAHSHSESQLALWLGGARAAARIGSEVVAYSEDTALRIDQEVKRFVTDNYERARKVLTEHKASLERVAAELLVREVLDGEQVRRIVAGLPLEDTKTTAPAGPVSPAHDEEPGRRKERPGIVPPLADPLPQE